MSTNKTAKEQAEVIFQRLYSMASVAKNEGSRPLYKAQIFPYEVDGQGDPAILRHLIKIANKRAGRLWQLSTVGPISDAKIFHWAELLEVVMTWIEQQVEKYEEITGELFEPIDAGLAIFNYTSLCPYETFPDPENYMNTAHSLALPDIYTGKTLGRLRVIAKLGTVNGNAVWFCKCRCGSFGLALAQDIKAGKTQSCGCYHAERNSEAHRIHGGSGSKLYDAWRALKERCDNADHPDYDHYGGRGIQYCEEWKDFQSFESWARSHGYAESLTLDRIDNDGDYTPANCRWATMKQQSNNRRTNIRVALDGQNMTLKQAAERSGLPYGALRERYQKNGEIDLFRPIKQKRQTATRPD